jgi:hypothetical protein
MSLPEFQKFDFQTNEGEAKQPIIFESLTTKEFKLADV